MNKFIKNQKGFTLVELMVAIAIIVIFLTVVGLGIGACVWGKRKAFTQGDAYDACSELCYPSAAKVTWRGDCLCDDSKRQP